MTNADNPQTETALTQEGIKSSLTREGLYALVWSEPMLKVAEKLGVSSSYMARVCTSMNVPRPERGYWAKLVVGKVQEQVPLPEALPGDVLVWSKGGGMYAPMTLPKPPERVKRALKIPTFHTAQHPLISGTKELFESGRLSYECGYLKPNKKLLVDFVVTKNGLDKVLSFANRLFLSLEECGYRVVIAPSSEHFHREKVDERENPNKANRYNNLWTPSRITVVYIGTVAIGLTVIEMSEEVKARYVNGEYVRETDYVLPKRGRYAVDHTWSTTKDFPTGRLCLQAYSPYPRASWNKQWKETKPTQYLGNQIKGIVKELEDAAVEIARLAEEGMRQAESEHQKWEAQWRESQRQVAERRHAEALKASNEDLIRIIDRWAQSNRIELFFADAERRVANLEGDEKLRLSDRLRRARELIGSTDALEHFLDWKSPEER